jgi:hypothetical protein
MDPNTTDRLILEDHDQGDAEKDAAKEPTGDEGPECPRCHHRHTARLRDGLAECFNCQAAFTPATSAGGQVVRNADGSWRTFGWGDGDHVDYDPAEDADSELVGNLPEEDPSADDVPTERRSERDIEFALRLEPMPDDDVEWLLTWVRDERLRRLAEVELNTRAVERAASEAQKYLDANEGGWALPNQETPE